MKMTVYVKVLGICLGALSVLAAKAPGDTQPSTLQELQAFYPSVSDEANAALVYQKAKAARIYEYENNEVFYSKEYAPGIPVKPLNAEYKQLSEKTLAANAYALELTHQASSMTQCRYPVDLTQGKGVLLTHLSELRDLSRLLSLQAVNAADDKKPVLATQSILDIAAIAKSLRKEPVVISQLVRIACWDMAINTLEQVVNRVLLDDGMLKILQETMAQVDDPEAMTRAIQGELCIWMNTKTETLEQRVAREQKENIEWMTFIGGDVAPEPPSDSAESPSAGDAAVVDTEQLSGDAQEAPTSDSEENAQSASRAQDAPVDAETAGWPRITPQEKKECVQEAQQMVEESRLPYVDLATHLPSAYDKKSRLLAQLKRGNVIIDDEMSSMRRALSASIRLAGHAAAAQGAIAVERYRLMHRKLPTQWEDMVPEFLAAPIRDPFQNAGALKFLSSENGYIVYSIGQNLKDDGGTGDGRPLLDYMFGVGDIKRTGR